MPSTIANLECSKRCGKTYDATKLNNLCACGAPLLARYNLGKASTTLTRESLRRRPATMWRYEEVLPPGPGVSLGEGMTPLVHAKRLGQRMDFDIEIPVRMVWMGVPVVNAQVRVRYLTPEQGGISHYQTFRDTARISWTHSKLMTELIFRVLTWPARRLLRLGA